MARRKHRMKSPGLIAKARAIAASLIGLSPVLESAKQNLPQGNFKGFSDEIQGKYTGFAPGSTNFDLGLLLQGWGPIIGAIAFHWGTGKLQKRIGRSLKF